MDETTTRRAPVCPVCANDRWIYSETRPVRMPCPTCTNGWPKVAGRPITLRAPFGEGATEAVSAKVSAALGAEPFGWASSHVETPEHVIFTRDAAQAGRLATYPGYTVLPLYAAPVDGLRAEMLAVLERIAGMLEPGSEPRAAGCYAFDVGSETERMLLDVLRKARGEAG